MRDVLSEWYQPDDADIQKFLTEGIVVVDTNVLLQLYRVSGTQRSQIITALTLVGPRLWLPYQVALEFHRNRLGVIATEIEQYKAVITWAKAEKSQVHVDKILDKDIKQRINEIVKESNAKLDNDLTALMVEHLGDLVDLRRARTHDPVRDLVEQLFAQPGQIGSCPLPKDLDARRKKAVERFKAKPPVPPGYGDDGGKDDPSGDYLIWAEMIDHARDEGKRLLFVTNDTTKEDWFASVEKDKTVRFPRPELRQEFAAETGQHYYQVTPTEFLHLATKHLDAQVSADTFEAVKRAAPPTNTTRTRIRLPTLAKLIQESPHQSKLAELAKQISDASAASTDRSSLALQALQAQYLSVVLGLEDRPDVAEMQRRVAEILSDDAASDDEEDLDTGPDD